MYCSINPTVRLKDFDFWIAKCLCLLNFCDDFGPMKLNSREEIGIRHHENILAPNEYSATP